MNRYQARDKKTKEGARGRGASGEARGTARAVPTHFIFIF
jgi:hypothetical protein